MKRGKTGKTRRKQSKENIYTKEPHVVKLITGYNDDYKENDTPSDWGSSQGTSSYLHELGDGEEKVFFLLSSVYACENKFAFMSVSYRFKILFLREKIIIKKQ